MKNLPTILLIASLSACNNQNPEQNPEVQPSGKTEQNVQDNPAEKPAKENTEIKKGAGVEKVKDLVEMVYFGGGNIMIGSNEGPEQVKPAHEVFVDPFYLDKHPVTVAQFREFVESTGYKTDAEKFGDAGVFNYQIQQWQLLKGATWEYPLGPKKSKAKDKHPVTQVSWRDARDFAEWAGKRLPTEHEWEFAAKNGESIGYKYPWGDEPFPGKKYKANVWDEPAFDVTGSDGFEFTSPVGAFGEHPSGLTDMAGNVHEWVHDQFSPYPGSPMYFRKDITIKVIRGGAFTKDQFGVHGFATYFRGQNTWETSLFNTGFRCAADVK